MSEHRAPILCRCSNCPKYQIAGHVSGERLGEDEAGRVAVSANEGKPKREPRVSGLIRCAHETSQIKSESGEGSSRNLYT
jgi:hypothetical protein